MLRRAPPRLRASPSSIISHCVRASNSSLSSTCSWERQLSQDTMSTTTADYKDRQFLAVIGDEVRRG